VIAMTRIEPMATTSFYATVLLDFCGGRAMRVCLGDTKDRRVVLDVKLESHLKSTVGLVSMSFRRRPCSKCQWLFAKKHVSPLTGLQF